jgi:hypothetical protein
MAGAAAAAGGTTIALGDGPGGGSTPAAEGRLLPDLVQILPDRVDIAYSGSPGGTRTLLTFGAAAENHGSGPLIVRGSRPSRRSRTMTATQVVAHGDGSREAAGEVGRLRFVRSSDHRHWHLRDFMRFELRTPDGEAIGPDHKTGFCLGDRYDSDAPTPGEPSSPVYTSRCGLNRPGRLRVTEGISVGYGDVYAARLEGQYIDVTGLPYGRYVLVQRVNPTGRLLDEHSDNDVSSMLVELTPRGSGRTRARIVEWCSNSDSCPERAGE